MTLSEQFMLEIEVEHPEVDADTVMQAVAHRLQEMGLYGAVTIEAVSGVERAEWVAAPAMVQ